MMHPLGLPDHLRAPVFTKVACFRSLAQSVRVWSALALLALLAGLYSILHPSQIYHDSSADCSRMSALGSSTSDPTPTRLPLRSAADVLRDIPAKFPADLLEFTDGELLYRNATDGRTVRERIVLADSFDVIFSADASIPVAFLINLDRRGDRLDQMLSQWDGRVRFVRLSAKPHTGGSNGVTISHIALILTMERLGWPFALVFEDDAARAEGWDALGARILGAARATGRELCDINLGPSELSGREGFQVISPGLLWSSPAGTLSTTAVLWGRRAIAPAHAFLPELASATAVHQASIDAAFRRVMREHGCAPWVPARLCVLQPPGVSDNYEHGTQKTDFTANFARARTDLARLEGELAATLQSGVTPAELCSERFWVRDSDPTRSPSLSPLWFLCGGTVTAVLAFALCRSRRGALSHLHTVRKHVCSRTPFGEPGLGEPKSGPLAS